MQDKMIFVQQIVVKSNHQRKFDMNIEKHSETQYVTTMYCHDPISKLTWVMPSSMQTTAEDAFKEAMVRINKYLQNNGDYVGEIDNPCNCSYLSPTTEEVIASALQSQKVSVKENGQVVL